MWNQLGDGLINLFLNFQIVTREENQYAVLIFAIGCGLIGALAVVLDLMMYLVRERSLLNIRHGLSSTVVFFFAWGIGALIMGYLGLMLNIFLVSVTACALVGLGWPVMFVK